MWLEQTRWRWWEERTIDGREGETKEKASYTSFSNQTQLASNTMHVTTENTRL